MEIQPSAIYTIYQDFIADKDLEKMKIETYDGTKITIEKIGTLKLGMDVLNLDGCLSMQIIKTK